MNDHSRALDWTRRHVDSGTLPVAVFGVATSRGVEVIEAFGDAKADDHFSLFSITKPLVGIATARVVERGELSLRQPLSAVPGFGTKRTDEVRLEHLLSHTAGLVDPPLDDPRPLRETLVSVGQDFVAGTMNRYTNISFEGVAALVEQATGRDIYSHVDELNRFTGGGTVTFEASAGAHEVRGGEAVGLDVARMHRQRHPAAGAFANAEALLGIGSALLRSARDGETDLLHPATLAGMLRARTHGLPEPVPSPERREFGLTWNLRETSTGLLERRAFGHEGWSGTQWWIYPEHDAVFVMLTNLIDLPSYGVVADQLNNAFVSGLR